MTHEQHSFRLTHGSYAAEILLAGATLSRLTHAGRDLIAHAESPHAPGLAGALLAPWPNRVVDGRYLFAGERRELPITEQGRHHAIHGIAHTLTFAPAGPHTASTLTLTATLEPTAGYPWRLLFNAHFALDDAGLRYGLTTENLSRDPAPYGAGTHPYLVAGPGPVDAWRFELAVSERLEVAPDRLIPQRLAPCAAFDGPVGDTRHDHAFTGLTWEGDDATKGFARARVLSPDGTGAEISWDRGCPWVQVYTCDQGEDSPAERSALAVEPMTCAPDAFNAGAYTFDTGLLVLEPGAHHDVSWRISAL